MKIVIDSYAWIEQFTGSAIGGRIKELLESADQIYTPDVVLAEIARKYVRENVEDNTVKIRLNQIASNSTITHLDSEIAFEAAKCYLELEEYSRKNKLNTPSLFDAIILATARSLSAKVLTKDQHFKSSPETIWP